MHAWLFESPGHRPMLRFDNGGIGIPVNLHLFTRYQFLNLVGKRLEIGMQLSEQHFTVKHHSQAEDTEPRQGS